MIIDEIEELQVYINFLIYENNFKYNSLNEVIKDLRREYGVIVSDEQFKQLSFPVEELIKNENKN